MPAYFETHPLRFACTGCGRCCVGHGGDYYVGATRREQRRIADFLGVTWRWFRRRYITLYADGTEGLRWGRGRCTFLDDEYRCRIYSVRPLQCRTYPFWPEVVTRRGAWLAQARDCEGIGRGAVVALSEIRRILRKQRAAGE